MTLGEVVNLEWTVSLEGRRLKLEVQFDTPNGHVICMHVDHSVVDNVGRPFRPKVPWETADEWRRRTGFGVEYEPCCSEELERALFGAGLP